LGILVPYHDTVSLTFPPPAPGSASRYSATCIDSNDYPLPERFFAGGGTSLRGFALNQAGPRDVCTGFPVGGQAMLILNQEFPFSDALAVSSGHRLGAISNDGATSRRTASASENGFLVEDQHGLPADREPCAHIARSRLKFRAKPRRDVRRPQRNRSGSGIIVGVDAGGAVRGCTARAQGRES